MFILASLLIDFTGLWIIVQTLRSRYHEEYLTGDYTKYMKLLDMLNNKLDKLPVLFWIALGIAIGIIIMCLWAWAGFEKENKR